MTLPDDGWQQEAAIPTTLALVMGADQRCFSIREVFVADRELMISGGGAMAKADRAAADGWLFGDWVHTKVISPGGRFQ